MTNLELILIANGCARLVNALERLVRTIQQRD